MTSKYVTREIYDVLAIDHRCMHEIKKTILSFLFFSFLRFLFHLISYRHFGFLVCEICVHQSNSIEMLFRTTNASKHMVEQSRSDRDEVLMDDEMQNLLRIDIIEDPSAYFFLFLFRQKNEVCSRSPRERMGDSCFEIELNNKTRTRGDDR